MVKEAHVSYVVVPLLLDKGDYYSSEDVMEKYKAFKTKWGVE